MNALPFSTKKLNHFSQVWKVIQQKNVFVFTLVNFHFRIIYSFSQLKKPNNGRFYILQQLLKHIHSVQLLSSTAMKPYQYAKIRHKCIFLHSIKKLNRFSHSWKGIHQNIESVFTLVKRYPTKYWIAFHTREKVSIKILNRFSHVWKGIEIIPPRPSPKPAWRRQGEGECCKENCRGQAVS